MKTYHYSLTVSPDAYRDVTLRGEIEKEVRSKVPQHTNVIKEMWFGVDLLQSWGQGRKCMFAVFFQFDGKGFANE